MLIPANFLRLQRILSWIPDRNITEVISSGRKDRTFRQFAVLAVRWAAGYSAWNRPMSCWCCHQEVMNARQWKLELCWTLLSSEKYTELKLSTAQSWSVSVRWPIGRMLSIHSLDWRCARIPIWLKHTGVMVGLLLAMKAHHWRIWLSFYTVLNPCLQLCHRTKHKIARVHCCTANVRSSHTGPGLFHPFGLPMLVLFLISTLLSQSFQSSWILVQFLLKQASNEIPGLHLVRRIFKVLFALSKTNFVHGEINNNQTTMWL